MVSSVDEFKLYMCFFFVRGKLIVEMYEHVQYTEANEKVVQCYNINSWWRENDISEL